MWQLQSIHITVRKQEIKHLKKMTTLMHQGKSTIQKVESKLFTPIISIAFWEMVVSINHNE